MFSLALDVPALGAVRLRLAGHLDHAAARSVLQAAATVVAGGCSRLVVDLTDLTSYDDDTSYAVVGCSRLARWLPEGVGLVTGSEPGRALAVRAGVREEGIMALCHAS